MISLFSIINRLSHFFAIILPLFFYAFNRQMADTWYIVAYVNLSCITIIIFSWRNLKSISLS